MYINRTPALGLPQYEGSDRLQRIDMNAAYEAIDAAIAARPAADGQGRYPAARLAEQAQAASPGGPLDTRLAAILNVMGGKADLGADGKLQESQIPPADRLPFTAPPGMKAPTIQQALDTLSGYFNSAGAAKDTAALGGISANNILVGTKPTVYVSPSGNDTEGDGSENKPWRTITRAIAKIHTYHSYYRINIAAGDYQEDIVISYKNAGIFLAGPENGTASVHSISIYGNSNIVKIENLNIVSQPDDTKLGISITDSTNVYLNKVTIQGNNKKIHGIYVSHGNVYIASAKISDCNNAVVAVYASLCYIHSYQVNNQTGSNNNVSIDAYNSIVMSPSAPPAGMAATQYSKRNGSAIFVGGAMI